MKPNTRVSKDDCDLNPKPDFHRRYRGIVSSLGYLVTMTSPNLAWSYFELSKCVQFPGIAHMEAAEHVLKHLRDTWNESITYTRGSRNPNVLWGWVDADWAGNTDTRRSHTGYILMINGGPIAWTKSMSRQCIFVYLRSRIPASPPAKQGKRLFIFVKPTKILFISSSLRMQLKSIRIIWPVLPWVKNQCAEFFRVTLTSAVISCANSSRLVLSNSSLCANIKWSPMPSPSLCLHPHSSATAASWWAKPL